MGRGCWGGGGQGRCNREVFVKIKKKCGGAVRGGGGGVGLGGGVRVDVNEELKFLRTFKKNGGSWGVRLGGQGRCE